MARVALNKAQLNREKANLALYRRYLPALDLKRRQLIAARNRVRAEIAEMTGRLAQREEAIGADIPMLADRDIDLDGLVRVEAVHLGERNLVGQRLPVLERIDYAVAPYGLLVRPHWVDRAATALKSVIGLRMTLAVARRQLEILEIAVRKTTQRVNLFEKVLTPRAQANIRRIRIHLGDAERAAVVTAKIAKSRRETSP